MGSDPPPQQLVLSDIIHNMSPSPSLNDEIRLQRRSHSPEPLSEDDIIRMKVRLADMGFILDARSQGNTTYADMPPREKELGDMVAKLLDSFIDPSQLLRQAEFITWLGAQRDLLVQSFQEERRRWEAEREGWTRMAEALLAQRAKAGDSFSQKDEEAERQHAAHESENKSLREKLQDSQLRFSALESELNKLKPLLFMQPPPLFATTSSPHKSSTSQVESTMDSSPSKTKRKTADTRASREQERNDSMATPQGHTRTEDPIPQVQADSNQTLPRSEYYRRDSRSRSLRLGPLHSRLSAQSTPGRTVFSASQTPSTHPVTPKKSKSKHKKSINHNLLPLTADARTEHLLLAARRIGRERANMVSGLMRRIEKEKEELMRERETEYLERERSQKATGGNTGSGSNIYYRQDLLDFGVGTTPAPTIPSMPKTPKRAPTTTHFLTPTLVTPRSDFHPPTNQTPNSFVFVGTPAPISYGNSTISTTSHSAPTTRSTPKPTQTPAAPPATNSQAGNHPTPLASLLSAARSMMDDDSSESSTSPKARRRAVVLEHPESPLPKRRRVGNGSTSKAAMTTDFLGATPSPGPDRFRSALDVLADQAAAVFDSDQHSPTKFPSKPTVRNKGKDRRQTSSGPSLPSGLEEVDDSTPRGEPNSTRDSHSRMRTGSPVSTRSRSKVLLTERLSKESTKALDRKDGLADGQKGSPATPRMILSPGTRRIPSPLASLTSPTPPYAGPAGDTDTPDTTLMPPDAAHVNESMDSSSGSLGDGALTLPRSPSTSGGNHRAISGSPPLLPHRLQPNAETSHAPSQSLNEEEVAMIAITSLVATNNNETEPSVNSALNTGENAEGTLNGEDVNAESKMQGFHAASSPSRNTPDTDADAEGEMDVDTENDEAVIVNSSATHETLYLATSSPQPGKSNATPGEMSAKRNTGEERTVTHTES